MSVGAVVIAGIAGAVVVGAHLVAWLAQVADRRDAPPGSWVEVTGASVHYRRSGAGLPVLFVHGFAGDGRTFDRVVPLAAGEFDCVVIDRPGHGRSLRNRRLAAGAPMVQAAQLDELMTVLGFERYLVVCHSWGCYVGLALALLRPRATAGLVLVGCVAYAEGDTRIGLQPRALSLVPFIGPALWRSVAVPCAGSFVAAMGVLFAPEPVDEPFVAAITPSVFLHAGHVRAATQDFLAAANEVPRLAAAYRRIEAPVVLLTGEHDWVAPASAHAEPLSRVVPRAHLHLEPGAGHMLPITRPELVVAALEELAGEHGREDWFGG